MTVFGELLLFGTLVALANVLGGWLLARPGSAVREGYLLRYLIALGAGFMLAAIFIEILPEVVRLWTPRGTQAELNPAVLGAMTLLLSGYLLIHLF
ncbi:MAG: zinc and cadmium transporter, partial [Acidobacteriota bacterium]|nr:zinc and cadmium transporter [Acidobacteriota bacterium]